MAEIEHFVDPLNKTHSKFKSVASNCLPLLTAESQEGAGEMIYDLNMADAVT